MSPYNFTWPGQSFFVSASWFYLQLIRDCIEFLLFTSFGIMYSAALGLINSGVCQGATAGNGTERGMARNQLQPTTHIYYRITITLFSAKEQQTQKNIFKQ